MKVNSHLEKFHRLDALKQRLDRVADREIWIWTAVQKRGLSTAVL